MKAGRELDALVAKKVMGWKHTGADGPNGEPGCVDTDQIEIPFDSMPRYSTDIAAAWEVVDKMLNDGWRMDTMSSECGGSDVTFKCISGVRGRFSSDTMEGLNITMPHAICLAALKAMGVEA